MTKKSGYSRKSLYRKWRLNFWWNISCRLGPLILQYTSKERLVYSSVSSKISFNELSIINTQFPELSKITTTFYSVLMVQIMALLDITVQYRKDSWRRFDLCKACITTSGSTFVHINTTDTIYSLLMAQNMAQLDLTVLYKKVFLQFTYGGGLTNAQLMHHIWLILCAHQHHWHHPLFADGTEHGPVGHDSAVQEGCFFTSLTEEIWLVQTFCHYIWVIFYVHKHHWYHLILVDVTEHGPVGHHMQEGVFFSLIEAWLMHSLCHFIWLVLWAHHQGHYPSLADGTERLVHVSDGHHSTVQRCSLHFTYGGYFFCKAPVVLHCLFHYLFISRSMYNF